MSKKALAEHLADEDLGLDPPPVEAHVARAPAARLGPVSRLTSDGQSGHRSSFAGDRRLP